MVTAALAVQDAVWARPASRTAGVAGAESGLGAALDAAKLGTLCSSRGGALARGVALHPGGERGGPGRGSSSRRGCHGGSCGGREEGDWTGEITGGSPGGRGAHFRKAELQLSGAGLRIAVAVGGARGPQRRGRAGRESGLDASGDSCRGEARRGRS